MFYSIKYKCLNVTFRGYYGGILTHSQASSCTSPHPESFAISLSTTFCPLLCLYSHCSLFLEMSSFSLIVSSQSVIHSSTSQFKCHLPWGSPTSHPEQENPPFSVFPECISAALLWQQFSNVLFYSSSLDPSNPKDYLTKPFLAGTMSCYLQISHCM